MKAILLPLAVLTLLLGTLFAPALSGGRRLAFRDVSHFYQPLYHAIDSRIDAGQLPLWNRLDQFGVPVAGETTTALFYPGRLVFHLGFDTSQSLAVYVYLHLITAGLSVYWFARRCRCTVAASTLAAIVYAAGGPVLFLYCNPPFLVGAAWLPLAVGHLLEGIRHPNRVDFSIGSLALALMILGGDVQSAAQVIVFLLAFVLWKSIRRFVRYRHAVQNGIPTGLLLRNLSRSLLLIALAIGFSSAAASLQVIPSLQWSAHSVRRHSPPAGVAMLSAATPYVAPPSAWWKTPAGGTHQANIYDYSVGPWQWIGAVLPAACGEMFPENTRITRLLPAERRTWTPSLFLGVLPAACLLLRLIFYVRRILKRPGTHRTRLHVWDGMLLAGLLFSLGHYGPVWAIRELAYLFTGARIFDDVHGAIGGPYWFLVSVVPGYGNFRFPAKWLVFFSLGAALLTAHTISQLSRKSSLDTGRQLRRVLVVLIGVAGLAMLASLTVIPYLQVDLQPARDRFFGPLRLRLMSLHLFQSAGLLIAIGAMAFLVLRRCSAASGSLPIVLVVLTVFELTLLGRGLIGTARAPSEKRLSATAEAVEGLGRVISLDASSRWPDAWPETSSPDRLDQVEHAQQLSMFMRWHLDFGVAKLNSATSISHWRGAVFWSAVQSVLADAKPADSSRALDRLCYLLGADGTIRPRVSQQDLGPGASTTPPLQIDLDPQVRNRQASPIAAIQDWQVVDATEAHDRLSDHLQRYLASETQTSLLESKTASLRQPSRRQDSDTEDVATVAEPECEVELSLPERTVATLRCSHPTLVKFYQLQDGNWTARYRQRDSDHWQQAISCPVDFVCQGFEIPAGNWQVEFRYRPTWLLLAATFSIAGWATGLWLIVMGWRSRHPQ